MYGRFHMAACMCNKWCNKDGTMKGIFNACWLKRYGVPVRSACAEPKGACRSTAHHIVCQVRIADAFQQMTLSF